MLAPLLVHARQSAQLGRLEQRFLLQTRSLAFVDLISPKKDPFFEPSSSLSLTRGMKGYGTAVYCGPMFDIYIYIFYLTSTAPQSVGERVDF